MFTATIFVLNFLFVISSSFLDKYLISENLKPESQLKTKSLIYKSGNTQNLQNNVCHDMTSIQSSLITAQQTISVW